MERLKLLVDGIEKKIDFTEKIAKGIFKVDDNKAVKRNCETLNIHIQAPQSDTDLKQMLSKVGRAGIVTIRIMNEWIQFILLDYVEAEDFEFFLREVPIQSHEALRGAYIMLKVSTLADTDNLINTLGGRGSLN